MAFPFIPRDVPPTAPREVKEQLPQDFDELERTQFGIKVRCQQCGQLAVRKQYGDFGWVHEDDEVTVTTGPDVQITASWSHEVVLDVIEGSVVDR